MANGTTSMVTDESATPTPKATEPAPFDGDIIPQTGSQNNIMFSRGFYKILEADLF